MLNQPTSSPMMKRMLGFLSAACAATAIERGEERGSAFYNLFYFHRFFS